MPATTVDQFLAALPAVRRAAITAVRKEINRRLPPGYEEGLQWGMLSWYVPLATYPAGYGENPKVPVPLVSVGAPKSYMTLHMMCFYCNPELHDWFVAAYAKSGKKLDMGKGCVRFKTLDDLALDVVGSALARVTPAQHLANYQKGREALGSGKKAPAAKKPVAKKPVAKKPVAKKSVARKAAPKR